MNRRLLSAIRSRHEAGETLASLADDYGMSVREIVKAARCPVPIWICYNCGVNHGTRRPTMATMHAGTCDVCGQQANVTQGRDYGV